MADAPVGAQAGRFCGHAAHQLVGMKAALHQQLALGLVNQFHGPGCSRFTMGGVDDLELRDIEIVLRRDRLDLGRRSDQDRLDDAGGSGFADAPQRRLVAWMHHQRDGGRHLLGQGHEQPVILALRLCLAALDSKLRSWLCSRLSSAAVTMPWPCPDP